MESHPARHQLPRWTEAVLVAVPTWLAFALATTRPWALNPDGVSYLDQAAAWRAGDLANAINSYWSPGYPLLLAAWSALTAPLGLPIVPGAHALNVLIAAAFAASAARLHRQVNRGLVTAGATPGGQWLAWAAVLLVVSVVVVRVSPPILLSPDLLLATFLLILASSALQRVDASPAAAGSWWRLGLLAGAVYLVKTPGLPVGVLLVAGSAVAAHGATLRTVVWRGTWAALGCALVVLPWAGALSRADGRLTLGSSATLNRSWSWNGGVEQLTHARWQVEVRAVPRDAYGTHPLWYAPQRFIGTVPPATVAAVTPPHVIAERNFFRLPALRWHLVLLGSLLLVAVAARHGRDPAVARRALVLIVPTIAGMLMYLLVHVEERFYGGYLVLAVLAGASAAVSVRGRVGAWLVAGLLAVVAYAARPLAHAVLLPERGPYDNPHQHVIAKLRQAGVDPGDAIAVVGDPFRAHWALPAGVRIAATLELPTSAHWRMAPADRREVWLRAMREAGAEVVVLTHGQRDATVLPLPAIVEP